MDGHSSRNDTAIKPEDFTPAELIALQALFPDIVGSLRRNSIPTVAEMSSGAISAPPWGEWSKQPPSQWDDGTIDAIWQHAGRQLSRREMLRDGAIGLGLAFLYFRTIPEAVEEGIHEAIPPKARIEALRWLEQELQTQMPGDPKLEQMHAEVAKSLEDAVKSTPGSLLFSIGALYAVRSGAAFFLSHLIGQGIAAAFHQHPESTPALREILMASVLPIECELRGQTPAVPAPDIALPFPAGDAEATRSLFRKLAALCRQGMPMAAQVMEGLLALDRDREFLHYAQDFFQQPRSQWRGALADIALEVKHEQKISPEVSYLRKLPHLGTAAILALEALGMSDNVRQTWIRAYVEEIQARARQLQHSHPAIAARWQAHTEETVRQAQEAASLDSRTCDYLALIASVPCSAWAVHNTLAHEDTHTFNRPEALPLLHEAQVRLEQRQRDRAYLTRLLSREGEKAPPSAPDFR